MPNFLVKNLRNLLDRFFPAASMQPLKSGATRGPYDNMQYNSWAKFHMSTLAKKLCKIGATSWAPNGSWWQMTWSKLDTNKPSLLHHHLISSFSSLFGVLIIIKIITMLSSCVSLYWAVSPLTKGSRSYDHHQPHCCTVYTFCTFPIVATMKN